VLTLGELTVSIQEAERFIARATECLNELKRDGTISFTTGNKLTGACRRASLDLSRQLAELRRSQ